MNFLHHPLITDRPGHVQYAAPDAPTLSTREFLEKTLAAVKRRRGLIHGSLKRGNRVCALGALVTASPGGIVTLEGCLPRQLQKLNDSMPKATPEKRRLVVIEWLEARLKELN